MQCRVEFSVYWCLNNDNNYGNKISEIRNYDSNSISNDDNNGDDNNNH